MCFLRQYWRSANFEGKNMQFYVFSMNTISFKAVKKKISEEARKELIRIKKKMFFWHECNSIGRCYGWLVGPQ